MNRDIHNFCNEKPFIFITTQKVSNENWYNLLKNLSINFNVIFLFQELLKKITLSINKRTHLHFYQLMSMTKNIPKNYLYQFL